MKPGVVVRVGAAVFVAGVSAGVSLAGPVPVAVADDGGLAAEVRSGAAGSEADGSDGAAGPSRRGARTAAERSAVVAEPTAELTAELTSEPTAEPTAERTAEPTAEVLSEPALRSAAARGRSAARAVTAPSAEPVAGSDPVSTSQTEARPLVVTGPQPSVPAAGVADPLGGRRYSSLIPAPAAAVPVPAVTLAAPAAVTPAAATAAAPAVVSSAKAPVVAKPVRPFVFAAAAAVDQLLVAASDWLATLPSGPVTTSLQGVLYLVRRNLLGFAEGLGTGVNWGVKGTEVEVKNQSTETLVFRLDPDGIRGGTPGDAVILEPGQTTTFSGYHKSDGPNAVDIRLLISVVEPVSTATRMILVANNAWNASLPEMLIKAADPESMMAGKDLNRAYVAAKYKTVSPFIKDWDALEEGEDCSCDAPDSGGPAFGPMVYVARRDDSDDYKRFYVEIFSAGQYPTGDYPLRTETNPRSGDKIPVAFYCNGNGAKPSPRRWSPPVSFW